MSMDNKQNRVNAINRSITTYLVKLSKEKAAEATKAQTQAAAQEAQAAAETPPAKDEKAKK